MCVSSTGLSFISAGPMAAGVRVFRGLSLAPGGLGGCSLLSAEKRNRVASGDPRGAGLCTPRPCQALLRPCPDFSLTSSSCRKMRSSEKYLRLHVQRKYWKGSGLKFKCSLEGIPSFSAHSWYRYFLLEMSCAFH